MTSRSAGPIAPTAGAVESLAAELAGVFRRETVGDPAAGRDTERTADHDPAEVPS